MSVTITKEYIQMLIGLLQTDGKDTKQIVIRKLEVLIK